MTFRAIYPNTGEIREADWFHQNRIQVGLCEVCKQKIELRAGKSVETSVHFWHGVDATCPTIQKNRKKYEDLPSSEKDTEAGKALKQAVKDNAYLIYGACNAIVDGLKYAEFKEVIAKATEKGIWDYKGLAINYVPYLLITFHDIFLPKVVS